MLNVPILLLHYEKYLQNSIVCGPCIILDRGSGGFICAVPRRWRVFPLFLFGKSRLIRRWRGLPLFRLFLPIIFRSFALIVITFCVSAVASERFFPFKRLRGQAAFFQQELCICRQAFHPAEAVGFCPAQLFIVTAALDGIQTGIRPKPPAEQR